MQCETFFVPYDPNNEKFISIFCFSSPINPFCIFVCLFVLVHISACLHFFLSLSHPLSFCFSISLFSSTKYCGLATRENLCCFIFAYFFLNGIYLICYCPAEAFNLIYTQNLSLTNTLSLSSAQLLKFLQGVSFTIINFFNENLLSNEKRVQRILKQKYSDIHFVKEVIVCTYVLY